MLYSWADRIILTADYMDIPSEFATKIALCNVGKDVYPRSFNQELDTKITNWMSDNKDWLKA